MDLIDLQSFPDGSFKWLLVYQDHGQLEVGTVVQMGLANVDRAKMDHTTTTLVVVEQVGKESYRVANRAGVPS